jgi:hypothetical protein
MEHPVYDLIVLDCVNADGSTAEPSAPDPDAPPAQPAEPAPQ